MPSARVVSIESLTAAPRYAEPAHQAIHALHQMQSLNHALLELTPCKVMSLAQLACEDTTVPRSHRRKYSAQKALFSRLLAKPPAMSAQSGINAPVP